MGKREKGRAGPHLRTALFLYQDCKEKAEMGCKGRPKPRRWLSLALAMALITVSSAAWAASSMTVSHHHNSYGLNVHVIKLACVAETDGTFTNKTISEAIASAGLPKVYYQMGYFLIAAWAVNPAATYPTSGAVTITDSTGLVLVGTGAGDTLTLSTASNGVTQITNNVQAIKRPIVGQLTVAVTDTGTAANTFTLYLLMGRYTTP